MELIVQKREKFGRAAESLRNQGFIPAELYGHGLENLHLSVPAKEFMKVFKQAGESTLVNIVLGTERRPVLIHDVGVHPVTDEILNVDFYQVRLDEKIKVKVALNFIGESPAVKGGGVLVKSMQEIEIEALPASVPHALDVDLSALKEIGNTIYVNDIKAPADVRILVKPETPVASVIEQMAEEVVAPEPVTVDSVKVETEEKKAERDAKKAASAEPGTPAGEAKHGE